MSGHSKWHTIKRAKGKTDAARGRLFNRIIREITVAARMGGGDVEANPRLRAAVANAKSNNMPGKNVDTAILKGTGQLEGVSYEEVTFEGYGPSGVALLIDCLTDNRNRTVAEVRHALTKANGSLGNANSVNWMFHSKGSLVVAKDAMDEEKMMEVALESGAEDMVTSDDAYEIVTSFESFTEVRDALEKLGVAMESSELQKVPENTVAVSGEDALKVMKLIDALDELDDTQNVSTNAEFSDEDMEAYANQ